MKTCTFIQKHIQYCTYTGTVMYVLEHINISPVSTTINRSLIWNYPGPGRP